MFGVDSEVGGIDRADQVDKIRRRHPDRMNGQIGDDLAERDCADAEPDRPAEAEKVEGVEDRQEPDWQDRPGLQGRDVPALFSGDLFEPGFMFPPALPPP